MSHSLEANNHNIMEEAVNVAKRASFDNNSLSHLESLASERAQLVHKHRELHDDDAEQDVTSVGAALSDDPSNRDRFTYMAKELVDYQLVMTMNIVKVSAHKIRK